MWQAECAWVWAFAGPGDLEGWYHHEGPVCWASISSIGAPAKIDVEECGGMPLEPAGLDGNGAAEEWPFRAVLGQFESAAWVEKDVSGVNNAGALDIGDNCRTEMEIDAALL